MALARTVTESVVVPLRGKGKVTVDVHIDTRFNDAFEITTRDGVSLTEKQWSKVKRVVSKVLGGGSP